MKHKILSLIALLAATFSFSSCNFLEIEPLDSFDEGAIFSDPALTETYVNGRYRMMTTGYYQTAMEFVSDEAMNNFNWQGAYTLNRGQMTPDQMGGFDVWWYYGDIKDCNVFFEKIGNLKGNDQMRDRLTGEMLFLRSYFYSELVRRYGGVPYITKTFALDGEMMIPRNSYEDCIDSIVSDLDKAAKLLPIRFSGKDFGRATKGAALALKSRMLLHAASPLWNPSNDKAKWQAAADAAKEVIDLNAYSLDPDYGGMFLNNMSKEHIFLQLFTEKYSNWFDWQWSPNGFTGYSAACVLQDLVDAYEKEDGTMPTEADYQNNQTPWEGRDPRFYASIVYDGCTFRGRQIDFSVYTDADGDGKSDGAGLDSEGGRDSWNYSKSHYTQRKFMDESLANPWSDPGSQPWVFIRLGEIYLNYAEALYELGDETTARLYLNKIRERARGGRADIVPDVTASGTELRDRIRQERRVELAFEEHRFFDVRRWKIADVTENKPARGMKILKNINTGERTFTIEKIQDRAFLPQHYLFPIPISEIRKNSLLEQNPNY